jgi:hypothetical protein
MQDDGIVFPIYIRPNATHERPFAQISQDPVDIEQMLAAEQDPYSFTIMDWRNRPSHELMHLWEKSNIEPLCVQSILINGKGSTVCPPADELAKFAEVRGFGNLTELGYVSRSCTSKSRKLVLKDCC